MTNRGSFGSNWGQTTVFGFGSTEGGEGEIPLTDGSVVEETEGEEQEEEEIVQEDEVDDVEESTDEQEEDEVDEETRKTVAFIGQLKDQLGFEVTEDDIATYGSDLKAIFEGKRLQAAEQMLADSLGSLNPKEAETVSKLLKGFSIQDVLELETNFPTYSEESVLADPELQKKVIIENEKLKGRTEKQIAVYLKGLGEDLSEDALEAAKELNGKREERAAAKEKAIQDAKEEAKRRSAQITQSSIEFVDKLNEFIPNVKLTPTTKAAIKAKFSTTMEKINGDLGKYIPSLAILDHYGLLDGNFEAVKSVKVASANTTLTKAIKESSSKRTTTRPNTKEDNILAYLRNLKQ